MLNEFPILNILCSPCKSKYCEIKAACVLFCWGTPGVTWFVSPVDWLVQCSSLCILDENVGQPSTDSATDCVGELLGGCTLSGGRVSIRNMLRPIEVY